MLRIWKLLTLLYERYIFLSLTEPFSRQENPDCVRLDHGGLDHKRKGLYWALTHEKEKLWKIFSGCNMNWTESDFFGDKLMLNSLWRMMIIGTHWRYSLHILSPNSRWIAAPAPHCETIRCLTIISCGKKKVQKCSSTSVFCHRHDFICSLLARPRARALK